MKFLPFFRFLFDFSVYFVIKKNIKRGLLFHRPRGADVARMLTWRAELTWCTGLARMRRGN